MIGTWYYDNQTTPTKVILDSSPVAIEDGIGGRVLTLLPDGLAVCCHCILVLLLLEKIVALLLVSVCTV